MLSTSFTLNTLDTFHCAWSSYQFLPWRQCTLWPVVTIKSESLSSLPLKDTAFAKAYMFASHTEDWVFEFQSRQFKTSETGSGSSRVKCSETVVNVTALLSWMAFKRVSCHYRCGTIKNSHWSTDMNIASSTFVFTGNGDVSIRVKNFQEVSGQTIKQACLAQFCAWHMFCRK